MTAAHRQVRPKYFQMGLYLVLLSAAIAAMTVTRRCSTAPLLPAQSVGNSRGDTLDVAIIYGPMSYYLYDDTLGGLNHDLLLRMGDDLGRPVRLWPVVNLHESMHRLETHTYDIIASLPSDGSVKSRFLTTQSIFLDRLVLVQREDDKGAVKVRSALDLAGDTVRIQRDSPAASRLSNLSNEIGAPIEVVREEKLSEEYLCIKVANGEIPLAVVNEKTAERMQKEYPRLSYDNPISFTQFQVWLLAKGDTTLLRSVDTWIDSIRHTPTYTRLLDRY